MSGIMLPLQLSEASSRDTASSAAVEAAPALAALLTAALAAALAAVSTTPNGVGALVANLRPPFWMALAANGAGCVAHASALAVAQPYLRAGEAHTVLLLETVVSQRQSVDQSVVHNPYRGASAH